MPGKGGAVDVAMQCNRTYRYGVSQRSSVSCLPKCGAIVCELIMQMSYLLNCWNLQHVPFVSESNWCAYIHSDLLSTLFVFFVRYANHRLKVIFPG